MTLKKEIKHDWQPTDTKVHCMQCTRCGIEIYFFSETWDKEIDAPCPVVLEDNTSSL